MPEIKYKPPLDLDPPKDKEAEWAILRLAQEIGVPAVYSSWDELISKICKAMYNQIKKELEEQKIMNDLWGQLVGTLSNPTVDLLNRAFEKDPNAIHALICNRVPCNQSLADDPDIQIDASKVLPEGNYQVGLLGFINGILQANKLPLVAAKFTDQPKEDGRYKLLGFCEYKDQS